jgi:hypothetical protein
MVLQRASEIFLRKLWIPTNLRRQQLAPHSNLLTEQVTRWHNQPSSAILKQRWGNSVRQAKRKCASRPPHQLHSLQHHFQSGLLSLASFIFIFIPYASHRFGYQKLEHLQIYFGSSHSHSRNDQNLDRSSYRMTFFHLPTVRDWGANLKAGC